MSKFKNGDIVWDKEYNESFKFDDKRDFLIPDDRLERYIHQDRDFSKICNSEYCKCNN